MQNERLRVRERGRRHVRLPCDRGLRGRRGISPLGGNRPYLPDDGIVGTAVVRRSPGEPGCLRCARAIATGLSGAVMRGRRSGSRAAGQGTHRSRNLKKGKNAQHDHRDPMQPAHVSSIPRAEEAPPGGPVAVQLDCRRRATPFRPTWLPGVLSGVGVELRLTALGAEVVRLSVVLTRPGAFAGSTCIPHTTSFSMFVLLRRLQSPDGKQPQCPVARRGHAAPSVVAMSCGGTTASPARTWWRRQIA